jgi:hypothetical protein
MASIFFTERLPAFRNSRFATWSSEIRNRLPRLVRILRCVPFIQARTGGCNQATKLLLKSRVYAKLLGRPITQRFQAYVLR